MDEVEFLEMDEVVPHDASENSLFRVLPELTPVSSMASFARHRQTVNAAWQIEGGVAVVEVHAVLASLIRESRTSVSFPAYVAHEPGLYFVGESDAVWRGEHTWLGQNLSTSDQFGSGHLIVVFADGSEFEAVGPTWIEYAIVEKAPPNEVLTAFMSSPKPSGWSGTLPGRATDWKHFRPDPIWLCSEYRERRDNPPLSGQPTDRFLKPGTRVVYNGSGTAEHGIVVHCWIDEITNAYDCLGLLHVWVTGLV